MDSEYAKYLLEKTRQDYNLIAEDFARTREKPWPELQFLFDDYLVPGDRVLDLGCGNGRYYEAMKDKKVDYIGIDNSEELIEIAQKRYPEAKFQVADALNLPFPDNYFDKVYSIAVFHHIPSKEFRLRFLREAKRVLKPGGLLIILVWNLWRREFILRIIKYTILKIFGKSKLDFKDIFYPWGKITTQRYLHCFSKKELENLVKKVDFKIHKMGLVKNERGNRQNIYLIAES